MLALLESVYGVMFRPLILKAVSTPNGIYKRQFRTTTAKQAIVDS